MAFDHLNDIDEEIDILQLIDTESDLAENNTNQKSVVEPIQDSNLCGTCVTNRRDCLLDPCGHVYFCMECWEKHQTYDPTKFDLTDEDGNIIEQPIMIDEPLQPVRCPYCKEKVEKGIQIRLT